MPQEMAAKYLGGCIRSIHTFQKPGVAVMRNSTNQDDFFPDFKLFCKIHSLSLFTLLYGVSGQQQLSNYSSTVHTTQ